MASMALFAVTVIPAHAAVDQYSVEPSQRLQINLDVCSAESQLAVRGDTGTDLDFEVTAPDGENLYSDAGIDDYISLVLQNDSGECAKILALGGPIWAKRKTILPSYWNPSWRAVRG